MAATLFTRHAALRTLQRGFTLIEVLVTLAVVAVMLGLATPSFISFQRNAELTSAANSFVAALSVARAEAMKRQLNAFVVPAAADDWVKGWTAFVDVDGNNELDIAIDTVILDQPELPGSITVDAASDGFADAGQHYVMFAGSGFTRLKAGGFKSGALQLTNSSESRRIIANPSGRFRVCKPADAGCNVTDPI